MNQIVPPKPKQVPKNLNEIMTAIEPFLPSSKGFLRTSLVSGYNSLKAKVNIHNKLHSVEALDFGGIPPAMVGYDINGYIPKIDNIVNLYLGAKRDGINIYWDTEEGKYLFDVESGKVEKCQ